MPRVVQVASIDVSVPSTEHSIDASILSPSHVDPKVSGGNNSSLVVFII